jgi:single-strand DNA-binding protein
MSSRSLNLVQIIGNLTRDPEQRYTPNGTAVCTMSVATNRSWSSGGEGGQRQEETQYHRIVTWSKLAEICGKYLKKGNKVYVQGRLQTRKWQTKEGQERETTEIVADNVIILTPGGGGQRMEEGAESSYEYPQEGSKNKIEDVQETVQSGPDEVADVSDDIPF